VRDAVDAAALSARWDRRAGSQEFVSDQQHADERCCRGRPNRVVLTPRRWRQALRRHVGPTGRGHSIFAGDGGKRARSPGRARHKPLKPLRRECRVFRGTCGFYPVLSTLHRGLRVQRAPGVPCALYFGRRLNAQLGRTVSRARSRMWTRRHCEERSDPDSVIPGWSEDQTWNLEIPGSMLRIAPE
jgi:hypothetical protein